MTDSYTSLADKISFARELSNKSRSERLVHFRSIGELLVQRSIQDSDKEFLIWFDRQENRFALTYREILLQVRTRVEILRSKGILPGDRVGVYAGNFPETVLTYFACWFNGCTVVPLSVSEDDQHLRFIIANSLTQIIFTRPELVDGISRILSSGESPLDIPLLVEDGDIKRPSPDSVDMNRRATGDFPPAIDPDSEALIVYTSGTTGNPKGVVLDQYNLMVDAKALAEHHRIKSKTRMMCVLPLHHVNGTVVTLVTPLFAGASVVLNERFSVHHFFPRLTKECVEVISVVPTLLAFLLEANASSEGMDLRLHHIICGAGPLTVDLASRFEDRYGIPIAHGYGLSETTCYSCCLPVDQPLADHRRWMSAYGYPSIGHALPVNEMAIFDSEGNALPAGMRGEIVIRGHNVMREYFDNEPANLSAFEFGWFRSGDEGFWLPDENGTPYFFITGRLKELIIRGGVNIAPLEIDEALMAIPGVRAGIAVGFPHDLYGEEVGAYVQLGEGVALKEEDIIEACKSRLPFAKAPKVVIFGDHIPVTSTGKYQRNKLKHLFSEWKTARFK